MIKILALSDRPVSQILSPQFKSTHAGVDLVVSCGDLPQDYLEHVLAALKRPLAYVPGNHDLDSLSVSGAANLDGRMMSVAGLRLCGFGGSIRYKLDGRHQYTQAEMWWRIIRSGTSWWWPALRGRRAFDVLLAHAPPRGIHDLGDHAHTGFDAFLAMMRWARPSLMLHGHVHARPNLAPGKTTYHDTVVYNVFPSRVIELSSWAAQRG